MAWALNGYRIAGTDCNVDSTNPKTDLLKGYAELGADGSTACAMWIYSGMWNNNDAPLDPAEQPLCRRNTEDKSGIGPNSEWAFSWPSNRRILYNRNSCDMQGKPWNEDKKLMEWNGEKWILVDQADFVAVKGDKPVPPNNKTFFMLWEQNARLESYGMVDGPLPEHFEPFESPCDDNPLNGAFHNPCAFGTQYASTKQGTKEQYPIVTTTYSVTEHWQTGGQTRLCPALVESMPSQFVEMSEEFAAEKGIKNGDDVRVFNNRGSVVVPALVTKRLQPMNVNGKVQHQVGLTHHFGWANLYGTGDVVNDLTPNVGDPNSFTPEYKAFLVDIEKA